MLYNTGTIAINGNTATGTGTNWTAPVSQVRAGQTIIVMSNPVQLFQISSVNSATSLTVTPAASPALNGQKYGILVSDIISVDGLAQAMSQLINEYDENIGAWETFATTSTNQTITVTINGASVTIPGIGGLARKGSNSDITQLTGLTTALSVAQGGTGGKDAKSARTNLGFTDGTVPISLGGTGATKAEDARTNLGLGSSATKDVGALSGNVLGVGYFGFGTPTINVLGNTESGFYGIDGSGTAWAPQAGSGIVCGYDATRRQQIFTGASGNLFVRNLGGSAMNTASATIPWTQMQSVGTSDINFKHINGDLDVDVSLENICQMEFKRFYYLDDDGQIERRGVIAQQIEQIDKEYVHSAEGVGKMTLDLNPLMMDALAAIQALAIRIRSLEKEVAVPDSSAD